MKKLRKFTLVWPWVLLVCGLLMMVNIFGINEEAVEITATVAHTYISHERRSADGPRMRVEWVDLNGEIRTEGNIDNSEGYVIGDEYPILVDAKEHKRVIRSKGEIILSFVFGVCMCIVSIIWMIYMKKRKYVTIR